MHLHPSLSLCVCLVILTDVTVLTVSAVAEREAATLDREARRHEAAMTEAQDVLDRAARGELLVSDVERVRVPSCYRRL